MFHQFNPTFPIFLESSNTATSDEILTDYKESIRTNGTAILAGVFRGRFAEGADLPDELARVLIICGIPFARLKDPTLMAKRSYYEGQARTSWNEWYQMNAYRLVVQALGRGWRNRHDYAIGILLDSRYQGGTYKPFLPYWLRSQTEDIPQFEELKNTMTTFLKSRQPPPQTPAAPPPPQNFKDLLAYFEKRIRECIESVLAQNYSNWWAEAISPKIRAPAMDRLEKQKKKDKELGLPTKTYKEIEFVDFSNYYGIIKSNWKYFEDILNDSNRVHFFFDDIVHARNALAHHRDLDPHLQIACESHIQRILRMLD